MSGRQCLLVGINAKYIHLNPAVYSLKYSVDDELQETVGIAEYTINHLYEHILMDIFSRKPGMIGFSCYIWNMDVVTRLCRDLAKIMPEVPVWLGGPEAAWAGEELFRELPSLAGVMYGEGEVVFPGLLRAWKDGTPLSEVPGLRYIDESGKLVATGEPEPADMDRLPFIYSKDPDFEHKIVYYESSRGCPFRCSYCLSAREKQLRFRSLKKVLAELQWFLDKKVPQVKFLDRTFNSSRSRTAAIWQYLHDHDNGLTNFHFEITAELLGQEEIELLKQMRPGLVQLEIGVQSTNPQTLEAINRHTDWEKVKCVTKQIGEMGNVHQHLDLIAGLPWEDMDRFSRSFNDVYGLKPSQLQLGFLKVLKGSPIAAQEKEFGLVYRGSPPYEVLATRWISYEDIVRLKGIEEMVETYYNSRQFELTVQALEWEYESAFAFYDALAEFCRRENPERKSLSRTGIFLQLQRFIHENFVNRAEVFDTLLTMDYYLRDNARNRPVFAVGKELHRPGYARDYHVEEIDFDLELFLREGKLRRCRQRWQFDYTCRSAVSGNALLRKENIPI